MGVLRTSSGPLTLFPGRTAPIGTLSSLPARPTPAAAASPSASPTRCSATASPWRPCRSTRRPRRPTAASLNWRCHRRAVVDATLPQRPPSRAGPTISPATRRCGSANTLRTILPTRTGTRRRFCPPFSRRMPLQTPTRIPLATARFRRTTRYRRRPAEVSPSLTLVRSPLVARWRRMTQSVECQSSKRSTDDGHPRATIFSAQPRPRATARSCLLEQ
jgi:hypothetical protein